MVPYKTIAAAISDCKANKSYCINHSFKSILKGKKFEQTAVQPHGQYFAGVKRLLTWKIKPGDGVKRRTCT